MHLCVGLDQQAIVRFREKIIKKTNSKLKRGRKVKNTHAVHPWHKLRKELYYLYIYSLSFFYLGTLLSFNL